MGRESMSNRWIRKNDLVVVIAGNEKGKKGKVLARKKDRVLVQGLNLRKKHIKRTQKAQTAQILDIEEPIHISNVQFCNSEGKRLKMKVKRKEDGERELVHFENGKELLFRPIHKPIE
jgi:large subunit ribosomal protein L24